ncbi:unnamed protein product, partial [Trichobilharzia regenti]
ELILYLYQLVQALRYENWHDIFSVQPEESSQSRKGNTSSNMTKDGNADEVKSPDVKLNRRKSSSSSTSSSSFRRRGGGSGVVDTSKSTTMSTGQNAERNREELSGWHSDLKNDWKV